MEFVCIGQEGILKATASCRSLILSENMLSRYIAATRVVITTAYNLQIRWSGPVRRHMEDKQATNLKQGSHMWTYDFYATVKLL
jgi:hypothetical protein